MQRLPHDTRRGNHCSEHSAGNEPPIGQDMRATGLDQSCEQSRNVEDNRIFGFTRNAERYSGNDPPSTVSANYAQHG